MKILTILIIALTTTPAATDNRHDACYARYFKAPDMSHALDVAKRRSVCICVQQDKWRHGIDANFDICEDEGEK
jgi:hypothetical protein